MTTTYTVTQLIDNLARAEREVLDDERSYCRHGTRLLDSVLDFHFALSSIRARFERGLETGFYKPEATFTRNEVGGYADIYAGQWFCRRLFLALVGER